MIDREMDAIGDRDIMAGGEEQFGDKAPRRYQRRRPRQVVPDYIDW